MQTKIALVIKCKLVENKRSAKNMVLQKRVKRKSEGERHRENKIEPLEIGMWSEDESKTRHEAIIVVLINLL